MLSGASRSSVLGRDEKTAPWQMRAVQGAIYSVLDAQRKGMQGQTT